MKKIICCTTILLSILVSQQYAKACPIIKTPCLTVGNHNLLSIRENNQYKKMYINGMQVNIRKSPNKNSKVITQLHFNDEVLVSNTANNNWYCVNLNKKTIGYVYKDYVSKTSCKYNLYEVPYAKNKTWMPYTAITNKSSKQYKLQRKANTGKYGIRMVNGRYCVALGSYFGCEIGQYFDLILKNGEIIHCIMGDQKDDEHTDMRNIITVSTNCLSEFIVDKKLLNKDAKRDGDISSCTEKWDSPVVQIKVYQKNFLEEDE